MLLGISVLDHMVDSSGNSYDVNLCAPGDVPHLLLVERSARIVFGPICIFYSSRGIDSYGVPAMKMTNTEAFSPRYATGTSDNSEWVP